MTSINDISVLVDKFSEESFGKDRSFIAPLLFLEYEVEGLKESGEMEDYVDCLILLLDSFHKRFPDIPAQKLLELSKEKIEVIIPSRTWKKIKSFK